MTFAERYGLTDTQVGNLIHAGLERPPVFSSEEIRTLYSAVLASGARPEGAGGAPFSLEGREFMREHYMDSRENPKRRVVKIKAAQTGLTVHLLSSATWMCMDGRTQLNPALFFPTQDAVYELHQSRFRPMLQSSSRLTEMVEMGKTDNTKLVRIGVSNMRFRGMSTGIGTDSFPGDWLGFDENRLMAPAGVERAFARVTNSKLIGKNIQGLEVPGIIHIGSTAGFPSMDIDLYFSRSTQNYWTIPCPNPACKNHTQGIIFPLHAAQDFDSIVGRDGSRMYYKCPDCGEEVPDSVMLHQGWYTERNPDARDPRNADAGWEGYQFSQIALGARLLPEIYGAWKRADNLPEVFNSRFGVAYRDPNAVLVTREVALRCIDGTGTFRLLTPEERNQTVIASLQNEYVAVGIDQRAGEKHCVVVKRGQYGSIDLLHVEVIEESGIEAIVAVTQFCRRWCAKIVLIDGEPSYDLANGVARALPRRVVWHQDYMDQSPDIVQWLDRRDEAKLKKASGETKYEYRAMLGRHKAIKFALHMFKYNKLRLPADFLSLVLPRTIGGVKAPKNAAEEFLSHLQNIAEVVEKRIKTWQDGSKGETGKAVYTFRPLAFDPHYVHAFTYAVVGLSQVFGGTEFMVAGFDTAPVAQSAVATALAESNPRASASHLLTCGQCMYWQSTVGDDGRCTNEFNGNLLTGFSDYACELFDWLPSEDQ